MFFFCFIAKENLKNLEQVHIYHKKYRRNHSLEEIVGMNNTLGELARHTATAYNAWPGRSKYLPHFERKEDIIPSQIL